MFRKSIFTAASPNTQKDDLWLAVRILFQPWSWDNNKYSEQFKTELKTYLSVSHVELIDSGRSAINILLKSLGVNDSHEVIIPSFTCVVVANAVRWTGATPIYLDTNSEDLNADYSVLAGKITDKTKAVVVQHTFGKIVDVQAIRHQLSAMRREDIYIIEDFAHTISRDFKLKGDAAILTFGIEKVISSVRGGAIITNSEDIFQQVQDDIEKLPKFPSSRVFISLLNPIFWWVAIPLHSVGFGRFSVGALIRSIWRKLGFLGIMVESVENEGKKPDWFPAQMSPALSRLGLKQLKKLDYYNEHRNKIVKIYDKYLSEVSDSPAKSGDETSRVYLRYPIILRSRKEYLAVWNLSRSLRVTLGNWFSVPLYGAGVNEATYQELCYFPTQTPETLKKCEVVLNLPTSINMSEKRAEELAKEIGRIV